ncbi:MAG: hypothetical protein GF350_16375 [Chitinivibrionales bacterium]|nr:hypothetical protein [Chitinivibrionales bacterium]
MAEIKDRTLRKNAVSEIKKVRNDWVDIFSRLIRTESDNQILTVLYDSLHQAGAIEPIILSVIADPESAQGFYLWICRHILSRAELEEKLDYTFAQKLIGTLNNSSFKSHHASLRKLFDPGALIDKAIRKFSRDDAKSFVSLLDRSGSLEAYRKDDLRNEIMRLFPDFNEEKKEYFYATAEMLEQKRKEFEHLTKVDIPENTEQLRIAKEQGDLRENFEYKAARMRQEMLSSRAKTLHDQLSMSKIIDPRAVDASTINIGTKVFLGPAGSGSGESQTITILGAWESDPSKHIYSHLAPAARALLGKKVSDRVEFNECEFIVEKIAVWNQ